MLFPPTSGNRHTGLLSDRVKCTHKTSPKCNKNGLSHLVRIHRLRTSYARPLLKVTLDLGQNCVLFVVSFPVMTVKIVLYPNIYNFWIIFRALTFIFHGCQCQILVYDIFDNTNFVFNKHYEINTVCIHAGAILNFDSQKTLLNKRHSVNKATIEWHFHCVPFPNGARWLGRAWWQMGDITNQWEGRILTSRARRATVCNYHIGDVISLWLLMTCCNTQWDIPHSVSV